jgi:hypothetical protein
LISRLCVASQILPLASRFASWPGLSSLGIDLRKKSILCGAIHQMCSMRHGLQKQGAAFRGEPPAATLLQFLLDSTTWHHCAVNLDAMLKWFESQAVDAQQVVTGPRLPRTQLQFDWLLCNTVSLIALRGGFYGVVALKWLLLPYLSRRHLRKPFESFAGDRVARLCWACAIQVLPACPACFCAFCMSACFSCSSI